MFPTCCFSQVKARIVVLLSFLNSLAQASNTEGKIKRLTVQIQAIELQIQSAQSATQAQALEALEFSIEIEFQALECQSQAVCFKFKRLTCQANSLESHILYLESQNQAIGFSNSSD